MSDPNFPAVGDTEWGQPLLDGLGQIIERISDAESVDASLPDDYVAKPSGGTPGQALILQSDGTVAWGNVATSGGGTTQVVAQNADSSYPARPTFSGVIFWLGTTPPADGVMSNGDIFFWVAT